MTFSFFFFFNDTATTEIYTLSLHDALPISPNGQPGSEPQIRMRAATAIATPSACTSAPCPAANVAGPLIIVDGTITRFGLADINSQDIERVEVVKGAAASSLYGSDAANGVIQVFTK